MKQRSPQIMKWIVKLLFALIIMFGVTYLFYLNPENAIFYFTSQRQLSAPMALIVLLAFGTGVIITAVIAILLGLHQKMISWSMFRKLESFESASSGYIDAVSFMTVGDYSKAEKTIKKILSNSPTDVSANILLAEIKEHEGETMVAVEILEKLFQINQQTNQNNAQLVFYLVDLYRKTGNESLAYEKLKPLQQQYPKSRKVLSLLIDIGEKLKDTAGVDENRKRLLSLSPAREAKLMFQ